MSEDSDKLKAVTRKPPTSLPIQIQSPWHVVLPTVYRYENSEWADRFFETGELRLSTFSKFSEYPDEIRGDRNEGLGVSIGHSDKQFVGISMGQGFNAYVLCCSSLISRKLQDAFGRDSAFASENTVAFAIEVAHQLPGFAGGVEGHCIYRSSTTIEREFSIDLEKYRLLGGGINMEMIRDMGSALGGLERLLLKRKSYKDQQEYRMLWHVDRVENDHIDIQCPKGRQFCRRVDCSEYLE